MVTMRDPLGVSLVELSERRNYVGPDPHFPRQNVRVRRDRRVEIDEMEETRISERDEHTERFS